jgi:hypothetical protein
MLRFPARSANDGALQLAGEKEGSGPLTREPRFRDTQLGRGRRARVHSRPPEIVDAVLAAVRCWKPQSRRLWEHLGQRTLKDGALLPIVRITDSRGRAPAAPQWCSCRHARIPGGSSNRSALCGALRRCENRPGRVRVISHRQRLGGGDAGHTCQKSAWSWRDPELHKYAPPPRAVPVQDEWVKAALREAGGVAVVGELPGADRPSVGRGDGGYAGQRAEGSRARARHLLPGGAVPVLDEVVGSAPGEAAGGAHCPDVGSRRRGHAAEFPRVQARDLGPRPRECQAR